MKKLLPLLVIAILAFACKKSDDTPPGLPPPPPQQTHIPEDARLIGAWLLDSVSIDTFSIKIDIHSPTDLLGKSFPMSDSICFADTTYKSYEYIPGGTYYSTAINWHYTWQTSSLDSVYIYPVSVASASLTFYYSINNSIASFKKSINSKTYIYWYHKS